MVGEHTLAEPRLRGFVPLEPIPTDPCLPNGRLAESEIGDTNPVQSAGKIWVGFTSPTVCSTSLLVLIQDLT